MEQPTHGVTVKNRPNFNYDLKNLKREQTPNYISATDSDINKMLSAVGAKNLKALYQHIPDEVKFQQAPAIGEAMAYEELAQHLYEISLKNKIKTSFLGSGLPQYKVQDIVPFVCGLRGLTTAYTPYQPERSQGTLTSVMIYQSALSELTGLEAINASLYDRSTCLFEALQTGRRLNSGKNKVILSEGIFASDREVIDTMKAETDLETLTVGFDQHTGQCLIAELEALLKKHEGQIAAVAFAQVNQFGILENVDALTDLCTRYKVSSIGVIDPMLLGPKGLKAPARWGSDHQGATMIVGEGQHLALAANFGGPGLGIFGIRYNLQNKNAIRSTAGRFIGKGKDAKGRDALCMVLSTREQHIRREKATSNICSNEGFVATIAGAGLLARGSEGMEKILTHSRNLATEAFERLTQISGVKARFSGAFFNEFVITTSMNTVDLINKARESELHIGVDLTARLHDGQKNALMIFVSDLHSSKDVDKLVAFFEKQFPGKQTGAKAAAIAPILTRDSAVNIKGQSFETLKTFYTKLSEQNVSPDNGVYPLGSCTMKYNPYINDWAASLPGFTDIHPEAPLADAQGSLEIIYETQRLFTAITGLAGLTTQPVAGAQGELTGIKLFQAYHRSRGEGDQRKIILIPRSAHGTNPASAYVAGFETKTENDLNFGIITIEANDKGEIDFEQFKKVITENGPRIAGMMATNPNTTGIFETRFKEMSDLIHSVGGLVYMDGANMNAIAGWVNLGALGVDAVHNNQHKTWSIPHGGGGPGDAIVAVSAKLLDFLPGVQVIKKSDGTFDVTKAKHSIGSIHRHFGNFAHKVRAYTYVKRLGAQGVQQMSAVAVLSARYLFERLKKTYPTLARGTESVARMHEFILTLHDADFKNLESAGTPKAQAMAKVGKLFLDFGLHAPTVAFPEVYGLMVEPTESFTLQELDYFASVVETIAQILRTHPEVLQTVPHFTPVDKVDEVSANVNLVLSTDLKTLPEVLPNRLSPEALLHMAPGDVATKILTAHKAAAASAKH